MKTRHVCFGAAALAVAALVAACASTGQGGGGAGENYISGTVTSSNGPEAGVWVVAETTELPTKYAKIVVTDDRGRYRIPDLPKANYSVWTRGYGMIDSPKASGTPGKVLNLTAGGAHPATPGSARALSRPGSRGSSAAAVREQARAQPSRRFAVQPSVSAQMLRAQFIA
jgi:hypothetical protein